MRPLSKKRQSIEREMIATYRQIESDRGMMCECCGSSNFEHSHNYPRNPFIWLIPNGNNITLLCRDHHLNFERNELWLLQNGGQIMRTMMALMLAESDVDRRKLMRSHYVRKLYAMQEQAQNEGVNFPGWCQELLNEIGI